MIKYRKGDVFSHTSNHDYRAVITKTRFNVVYFKIISAPSSAELWDKFSMPVAELDTGSEWHWFRVECANPGPQTGALEYLSALNDME